MNRRAAVFDNPDRSRTAGRRSSTTTSAKLPGSGFEGDVGVVATEDDDGNPGAAPSAEERRPHHTPTGSATTTGWPAASISSTRTLARYVLPEPRFAKIANVSVTASSGKVKPVPELKPLSDDFSGCGHAVIVPDSWSVVRSPVVRSGVESPGGVLCDRRRGTQRHGRRASWPT